MTTSAQRQRQRLIRDDRRVRVRQTVDGMLRRRAGIGPLRQRASDDRHRAERCGPEGIRINGLAKWAPPRVERLANAVRAVPGRQRRCRLSTAPWTGRASVDAGVGIIHRVGVHADVPGTRDVEVRPAQTLAPQARRRTLCSVSGPTVRVPALSVLPASRRRHIRVHPDRSGRGVARAGTRRVGEISGATAGPAVCVVHICAATCATPTRLPDAVPARNGP